MSENVDIKTYIPSSTKDLYQKNLNNNFSFIYKNFLEGKLRIYDHNTPHYYQHNASLISDTRSREKPFTQESFEHLREIIRVINEVFQNRWNLEITLTPHGTLNIIGFSVYFSKIRLTNNKNEEHILRDCYAFIPFFLPNTNSKTINLGSMFLGRSTQTTIEYDRCYSHSHQRDYRTLSVGSMENYGIPNNFFSDMCLGSEGEGILRALRIFNTSPTSDNLVAVLMNIISTIRYESLEGGPYKKIADYFYNSNRSNDSIFNLSVLNTSNIKYLSELLLKNALKNDENLILKFDVKAHPFLKKEIEFHDDLKLEEILIDSYKNLVESANNPNDVIKIVNNENRGVQANLSLLNRLFYQDITTNRKVYFNLSKYYTDRRTTRDPNKNNEEDEIIKINSTPIFYFRGNPVYSKVINPKRENQGLVDIKNSNLKISEHYFSVIKSNLTNKILQNVLEQTS